MDFKKISLTLRDYLILTVASFIFAFAWEGFMIPNGMSAGGMMGLCTIIQYATGGFLQAQYTYIGINAILIVIAVLAMGIGFGFKTIYCIVVSSFAMGLLGSIEAIHSVPGEFFFIQEKVLIPVFAGALEAVGIGLVLRYGGSTGGTDIISLMIDMVVGGKRSSYQLLVFSEKFNEIADHIINNMNRGVTVLKAQGWFTKSDKNVLLILINQKELPALTKVIKDTDPRAFMSISPTNNVYGEGFEEIKAGVDIKKKKKQK